MGSLPTDDCFVFVIKTDSYAGNFEREMCGYMTGQVGECDASSNSAALFAGENPGNCEFEDLVIRFPDEHGFYRPVTVLGCECTEVGIYFKRKPTREQLLFLRQRAILFAAKTNPRDGKHTIISIAGFRLLEYCIQRTEKKISEWECD